MKTDKNLEIALTNAMYEGFKDRPVPEANIDLNEYDKVQYKDMRGNWHICGVMNKIAREEQNIYQ